MVLRLIVVLLSCAAALHSGPKTGKPVNLIEVAGESRSVIGETASEHQAEAGSQRFSGTEALITATSVPLKNIHDHSQKSKTGWKSVHKPLERVLIYMDGQGYRQPIKNNLDMQYLLNITLGGQTVVCLPDTGSYDLVVATKRCKKCGSGELYYDPSLSLRHRVDANESVWKYYGSGALLTRQATDVMDMGPYRGISQSLREVTEAKMKVLDNSSFTAILGLGPSESVLHSAWESARKAAQRVAEAVVEDGVVNSTLESNAIRAVDEVKLAEMYSPVLKSTNERMFSVCIGREMGSDGLIVWNDTSAVLHPELFHRVPATSNHSWKVEVRNVRLSYLAALDAGSPHSQSSWASSQIDQGEDVVFENSTSVPLDCKDGCNVLLDTGASMLAMPRFPLKILQRILEISKANCSNMLELPHIVFEMGGKTFSLAPDAYAVELERHRGDRPATESQGQGKAAKRKGEWDCGMKYLNADVFSSDSWVFGLPFFRKYYTSFEVASSSQHRALHFAGASEVCTPIKSRVQVHDGPPEQWQRKVGIDSLRLLHGGRFDKFVTI